MVARTTVQPHFSKLVISGVMEGSEESKNSSFWWADNNQRNHGRQWSSPVQTELASPESCGNGGICHICNRNIRYPRVPGSARRHGFANTSAAWSGIVIVFIGSDYCTMRFWMQSPSHRCVDRGTRFVKNDFLVTIEKIGMERYGSQVQASPKHFLTGAPDAESR
jgi:hypothetical protein